LIQTLCFKFLGINIICVPNKYALPCLSSTSTRTLCTLQYHSMSVFYCNMCENVR
jgi:hypothetical protein